MPKYSITMMLLLACHELGADPVVRVSVYDHIVTRSLSYL